MKPHLSKATPAMTFQPSVSVQGVGRIGDYASAKHGQYCRKRHHWIVVYYDGSKTEHGYACKVAEELGTFKTKHSASLVAKQFAEDRGWHLNSYADGAVIEDKAET